MMEKVPVRHHIIPVCYLSRFTDEKGLLHIYDKQEQKLRVDKPDNICYIKHYNDLLEKTCEQYGLNKTAVESYYAKSIESEYNVVLETVCSIVEAAYLSGVEPIVDRDLISKHLWCQFLRLRPFAYSIKDLWKQFFQQMKEKCNIVFDNSLLQNSPSPFGDDPVLAQAQFLGFQSPDAEYCSLKQHTWFFWHSADGAFITSDYPIVTLKVGNVGNESIESCFFPIDAMLQFPLSPNWVLVVVHKDLLGGEYRKLNGRIVDAPPEFIAQFNNLQRDVAKRWVISSNDNIDLAGIRDINPFGERNIFVDKNKYNITWHNIQS